MVVPKNCFPSPLRGSFAPLGAQRETKQWWMNKFVTPAIRQDLSGSKPSSFQWDDASMFQQNHVDFLAPHVKHSGGGFHLGDNSITLMPLCEAARCNGRFLNPW